MCGPGGSCDHPIMEKKGCFDCHLKPMCKINDELDRIHITYNILGIDLCESAEKWCTFFQNYKGLLRNAEVK